MKRTSNTKRAFNTKRIIYSLLGLGFIIIGFSYLLNPLFGITGFVINGASKTTNSLLGLLFAIAGFFFLHKTRKRKKGQAAMEFLLTYGWAILASIIAMGTLMYLGVFGLSPPSIAIVSAPFFIDSSNVGLSNARLEIRNNGGQTNTIQQAILTNLPPGVTCQAFTIPTPISPGKSEIINIPCTGLNSGDILKADITITYTKSGSNLQQTSTGTITDTVVDSGPECSDGFDNDNDGRSDIDDPGCWDDENDQFTYNTSEDETGETPQCQNGEDDDGDGLTDWPEDPKCTDANDISEFYGGGGQEATECNDGDDNDGDVVIDELDPGCWDELGAYDPTLNDESAATTECQDRIDNDGNGFCDTIISINGCIDPEVIAGDTGCQNPWDNDESGGGQAGVTECSDTIDNEPDGLIDQEDPGCWDLGGGEGVEEIGEIGEFNWNVNIDSELTFCQDDIDNDGDGRIDWDGGPFGEPIDGRCCGNPILLLDCTPHDITELALCQNGEDDDVDGWIDIEDPGCWFGDPLTYEPNWDKEDNIGFECSDGIDNELPPHDDGLIDANDPDCDDGFDSETPECSDGRDNDGDTLCDWDGICDISYSYEDEIIYVPLALIETPDPECLAPCDASWDDESFCV